MLLSGIEGGRSGFDRRTFECQKCGGVQTSRASKEPMESNVFGWPGGELKPPRDALEEAREMPPGAQRTEALKKAGQLRRTADDQGLIFAKRGRPRK